MKQKIYKAMALAILMLCALSLAPRDDKSEGSTQRGTTSDCCLMGAADIPSAEAVMIEQCFQEQVFLEPPKTATYVNSRSHSKYFHLMDIPAYESRAVLKSPWLPKGGWL